MAIIYENKKYQVEYIEDILTVYDKRKNEDCILFDENLKKSDNYSIEQGYFILNLIEEINNKN